MSDPSEASRPRGRWRRRIGFSFLGLILALIAGHAIWGWWEERKLGQEVRALRSRGEPMSIEELLNRPLADGENAAILLCEAAESIDEKSAAWREFDALQLG